MSIEHTKNLYTISTVKQLIDINKSTTNFKCKFSIVSNDSKPFQAVVVTQSLLDKSERIELEQVSNGMFSGDILVNQNIYDNYFIIMKASEPTSVEVDVDFEPLPDFIPQGKGIALDQTKWNIDTKHIGIAMLVVLVLIAVWYRRNQPSSSMGIGVEIPPLTAGIANLLPRESLLENLKKIPL